MKGQDEFLTEFLDGAKKRHIVPVYQRNYDWKKENCRQLFDDLVRVAKEDKQMHFFGSIVSASAGTGNREDFLLIDGQQRVTTINLLMAAIVNLLKEGKVTTDDEDLCSFIEETYLINKRDKGRKVRLKPVKNDCNAFDAIINGDTRNYDNKSNVTSNYTYFYERIQECEITVKELCEAIEKLQIINIFLGKEDNPQLIFESLNSTGLALTEGDKIRNYVLMSIDAAEQEEYYDKYWNVIEVNTDYHVSEFVRDYLSVVQGRIYPMKDVYKQFKKYVLDTHTADPDILESLLEYSKYYRQITHSDTKQKKVDVILSRLNILDMSVTYPYLLSYFKYSEDNGLPLSETMSVLTCIETYIFRRLIAGIPTNSLNNIFLNLHKEALKIKQPETLYSSVIIYILQNRSGSGKFPNDEEFKQAFFTKNIYTMTSKNKQYIFDRLENGESIERANVISNMEDKVWTVEHIMPQTLSKEWKSALGDDCEGIHERWLNTIANLTLTGYNSKYNNRPFLEKRDIENGFSDSGLRINQFVSQCNKWTEEEILQRQEFLWEKANQLWRYPSTSFKPIQKEPEVVGIDEDYSFKNRKILAFVFQGTEYKVNDWTDMILSVGKRLFELDSTILYQLAQKEGEAWISTEDTDGFALIAEGIFLKHSLNNENKIRNIKKLFAAYGLSEEDLEFVLVPLMETED